MRTNIKKMRTAMKRLTLIVFKEEIRKKKETTLENKNKKIKHRRIT